MTGLGSAAADSAGLPWAGRTLSQGGFDTDDGRASAVLREALLDHAVGAGGVAETAERLRDLVALLPEERLLVPLVAEVSGGAVSSRRPASDDRGDSVAAADAGAVMSVPLLGLAGGGTALPAFTGIDSMRAWDPSARPVPVATAALAGAVLSEGCTDLVVDVAGPASLRLATPVVAALAAGRPWRPAWEDPDVDALLASVAISVSEECGACELAGRPCDDPTGLAVEVGLPGGMDEQSLSEVLRALGAVLATEGRLGRRVTSLAFRVRPLP
jgi:hypothetical protein